MERLAYPSDLTDDQWHKIEAVLPPARGGRTGRRRKYPLREVWNAVFYQARTGTRPAPAARGGTCPTTSHPTAMSGTTSAAGETAA